MDEVCGSFRSRLPGGTAWPGAAPRLYHRPRYRAGPEPTGQGLPVTALGVDDFDPLRVEEVAPLDGRTDDHLLDNGGHHCTLPVEV